jgi:hypothetical protein
MLAVTLMTLIMSTTPETGLYLDGQVSSAHLETAVLLEELQARLPELLVSTTPTQNQGKFYTLQFSEQRGDQGQTVLLFILQDSNQTKLFKRSLGPSADSLETARQIALVVEGVIKRRGDALREILQAQKPEPIPEPQPKPQPRTEASTTTKRLQLDAMTTLGTLTAAKRATVGAQIGAQIQTWKSLYLGLQLGFHRLLGSGQSNESSVATLRLQEWTLLAAASWYLTWGDLTLATSAGAGISLTQSSTESSGQSPTYRAMDTFFTTRVGTGLDYNITNEFSILAFVFMDFSPSHPNYTLQDQNLLNRGSISIFGALGCRYQLF